MKPTTLCFPKQNDTYLLGRKKRGFGAGHYNGFGGKIEDGETFRSCAVRELEEEVSLIVDESDLRVVGLLDFQFPHSPELSHISYVYMVETWKGIPLESEEMEPLWVTLETTPFEHMWAGDETWIPKIWQGDFIKGRIVFAEDNASIDSMHIVKVDAIFESEDLEAIHAWLGKDW